PPNNQSPITNNYLYNTGDLARWNPDGNIEFLGRIDNQVKIRGLRVELGEIENRILSHPGIKETVVISRESKGGDNFLCAYYVDTYVDNYVDTYVDNYVDESSRPADGTHRSKTSAAPSEQETETSLKNFLSQTLPGYMIPDYFIKLERIPLTPNEKIDRKALAKIKISKLKTQTYNPPRNTYEKKLTEIWASILELKKEEIGIDDNFFDIGGHSLRGTVMASKIHKEFDVKLPLTEIFKKNSIRTLAGTITEIKGGTSPGLDEKYSAIEPGEKKEYYVQSSAQKRLYILQQMELESTAYNMPQIIPLKKETEPQRLETVFRQLIRRHESLRTSFHMINERLVQKLHPEVEFKIDN
ncbi:MAG: AMP-binding protein, partial [bacterium]|nr:AMP-binding protein [bacterium]